MTYEAEVVDPRASSKKLAETLKKSLVAADFDTALQAYSALRQAIKRESNHFRDIKMVLFRQEFPRENYIAMLRRLYRQYHVDNQQLAADEVLDEVMVLNPSEEEKETFQKNITDPQFFKDKLDAFERKNQIFLNKVIAEKNKGDLDREIKFLTITVSALVDMEKNIDARVVALQQKSEQGKLFSMEGLAQIFKNLKAEIGDHKTRYLKRQQDLHQAQEVLAQKEAFTVTDERIDAPPPSGLSWETISLADEPRVEPKLSVEPRPMLLQQILPVAAPPALTSLQRDLISGIVDRYFALLREGSKSIEQLQQGNPDHETLEPRKKELDERLSETLRALENVGGNYKEVQNLAGRHLSLRASLELKLKENQYKEAEIALASEDSPLQLQEVNIPVKTAKLGYVQLYRIGKKLNEALQAGNITDAAQVDYHFRTLMLGQSDAVRKKETTAFRKKMLLAPKYLDILKQEYKLASEQNNQPIVEEIESELKTVMGTETFSEFYVSMQTPQHFKKKIDILEERVSALQRTFPRDERVITQEINTLEMLLSLLAEFKDKVTPNRGKKSGNRFVKAKARSDMPVSPGVVKMPRSPHIVIKSRLEQSLDKKIEFYSRRKNVLEGRREASDKKEAAQVQRKQAIDIFVQNRENKKIFQGVLDAIPGKPLSTIFKKRKPFDPGSFINTLTLINDRIVDQKDDATDKNVVFYDALLSFFRQLSSFKLRGMIENLNHPMFKNFFFAVTYYLQVPNHSDSANVVQLGFEGGLKFSDVGIDAQRPVGELQNLTASFISAFHEVLEERKIDYVNYFQAETVNTQRDVYPEIQSYIWEYATGKMKNGIASHLKSLNEDEQLSGSDNTSEDERLGASGKGPGSVPGSSRGIFVQ